MSVWSTIVEEITAFRSQIRELPVLPDDSAQLRAELERRYSFDTPQPAATLVKEVIALLRTGTVHVTHPRYFGLFNPSVREIGIAADTLVALYNPQLAAWSHAPAAIELEQLTLRHLLQLLGWNADTSIAGFTSGGAEANLSAVLAALAHRFPESGASGLAALPRRPTIYLTAESHHSLVKIARMSGLGTDCLRRVPTTPAHTLDCEALEALLRRDRGEGLEPLLVVGTAGTTATGAIDPLDRLAAIAAEQRLWLHVDAAWGGGALLSPRHRSLFAGVERADSLTWDAHKWLSVPMGAGMFFCRHPNAVKRAFAVSTSYMPPATEGGATVDPYTTSVQWSRRAIGLKLFMALAELGEPGYATQIEQQVAMGAELRQLLSGAGWEIVNSTPLPVICFSRPELTNGTWAARDLLDIIYERNKVWLSAVTLPDGTPALRACITSYETRHDDLECLLSELSAAIEILAARPART